MASSAALLTAVPPANAMGLGYLSDSGLDSDAESMRAEILSLRSRLESERALNAELSTQLKRSSRSNSLSQAANGAAAMPPPTAPHSAHSTDGKFPHSANGSVRPPFGTAVPSVGTPRHVSGPVLSSPSRSTRPRSALDQYAHVTATAAEPTVRRKTSLHGLPPPPPSRSPPPLPLSFNPSNLSPLSPENNGRFSRRGSTGSSSPGDRSLSSSVDRGQSRIPVAAVGTARALAGGEARRGSASPQQLSGSLGVDGPPPASMIPGSSTMRMSLSDSVTSASTSTALSLSAHAAHPPSAIPRPVVSPSFGASSSSSPFFGGSSAGVTHVNRIASANTNTGKVVSQLQIDLSTTRSTLEQTKTQLRVSQRAVEALGRQVDEHREARERIRVESETTAGRLARRERQLEDVLARAHRAEAELGRAQSAEREAVKRAKSLESGTADALARCARAESDRDALALGIASARQGWRRELDAAHDAVAKLGAMFQADMEQQTLKHTMLAKLFQGRASASADVSAALAARHELQERQLETIAALASDVRRCLASTDDSRQRTDDVAGELRRLRRLMRERAATVPTDDVPA